MEGLELEVLEFLATMADYVEMPVPNTRLSLPSSKCSSVPVRNDRVYPPALSLDGGQLKRKRTVSLGVSRKSPEGKKIVLFPASERFKGIQCSNPYVSLLEGQSKWKKSSRDTKSTECACTSVVSCTHNSS